MTLGKNLLSTYIKDKTVPEEVWESWRSVFGPEFRQASTQGFCCPDWAAQAVMSPGGSPAFEFTHLDPGSWAAKLNIVRRIVSSRAFRHNNIGLRVNAVIDASFAVSQRNDMGNLLLYLYRGLSLVPTDFHRRAMIQFPGLCVKPHIFVLCDDASSWSADELECSVDHFAAPLHLVLPSECDYFLVCTFSVVLL